MLQDVMDGLYGKRLSLPTRPTTNAKTPNDF
jgi:hypothetical protein